MGTLRAASVFAAALVSAGCAATAFYGLEPGRSTEAEVRRALGEPAAVYAAADGSRRLAYPRGPGSPRTYMAVVAPGGRLESFGQVLTEDTFRRIERGRTTGEDVERLIGPPWRAIDFPNLGQVAWDYRFQDAWGYLAEFSVMLDRRGIVADMVTVRFDREGSPK